ncbi:regulatory protein RecX [Pseudonocardia spirodelae]|uniref:Regulatory protein RecX n=1 Tax=Pseudonocardia spirodelae TaxID=3133431 RepID=A0ABU8T6Q8_9PSEU
MTREHDGAGGTSGRDGAEPAGPRTVPLDDLFGVAAAGPDGEGLPAIPTLDPALGDPAPASTGDGPADDAPDDPEPPAPTQVSFAALSGDTGASGPSDTAPRRLTLVADGDGDGAVPDPDGGHGRSGAPRVVSFEELSGRGTRRGGARGSRDGGRRGTGGRTPVTAPDRAPSARPGPYPGAQGLPDPGQDRRRGRRRGGPRGEAAAEPRTETPQEQETRARDICLRLLTDRARTVKELGDALRRKEIPDEIAHRVLDRFDEVGLVDDQAFAEQWVRSRHRHRGLGRRAIALELHRKGVDREIADEALSDIDDDSERDRARELVVRRLRSLPVGSREERQSTARKLVGMLARKGYGPGVAYGVVKEEIAAAGADADELGEAPPDD